MISIESKNVFTVNNPLRNHIIRMLDNKVMLDSNLALVSNHVVALTDHLP